MRRVDMAFQRLEAVGFALPGPKVGLVRRAEHRLERRQRWCHVALAHIDVDEAAPLRHLVSLRLDLFPEVLVCRQIGHIETIAGDVVFPAVINAAQAAFFVAAEEQRGAAMRAAVIEHADPPCAVAKGISRSPSSITRSGSPSALSSDDRQARPPYCRISAPHRGPGPTRGSQSVFICGVISLLLP